MSESTVRARKLRKNSTDAEQRMWCFLRKKRFLGLKFRRQTPIGNYIVDFLCCQKKIIIEIDGGQYNDISELAYDQKRTYYLRQKGYTVLRYWNNEVVENIDAVLDDAMMKLGSMWVFMDDAKPRIDTPSVRQRVQN
jgi:very-short-patch-repair endonuclease